MKKSYLMIAAAAALLAACSKTDTFKESVDNENVLIGFETFHAKTTKASVSAPSGLTDANGGFGVYGYKHGESVTASNGAIDLSDEDVATSIFENVKVWYVSDDFSANPSQGFTYAVPKYWDKLKTYTFFAYAPHAQVANANTDPATKGISFDDATGKFTRNDIKALQSANPATPATVSVNVGYEQAQSRKQYSTANEDAIIDYLIAPYVPGQKYGHTNQPKTGASAYTGSEQTVGFTFYHILSKLNVIVKAKDETGTGGHGYAGVKSIKVTKLNITCLPNATTEIATYAQTKVDEAKGTFTPTSYAANSLLNIIKGDNATSAEDLYILDGGNETNGTITNPLSYINQTFHYYVAPNQPATNTKHELNIDYTITYVDGTTEPYTRTIDLSNSQNLTQNSATLTKMEQNNVYNITITIGLNQIYFAVDAINVWDNATDTGVDIN